jgi:hypothetical protein
MSILILFLGIAIGVGASEGYSTLKVEASPACPSDNLVSQDFGFAIIPVISDYAWDIPICATVHPVSFDVQQGVHAAYLAELIKPPSVNYINRQANPKNYDPSLMQSLIADVGNNQIQTKASLRDRQNPNRMPRDGL